MRKYFGEIGLIITAIIWGSGFVATAVSLTYYTPFQNLAVRFFIGAIILGIVFYRKLTEIRRPIMIKGILLGTILYIAFALQTIGLQYTTPSKNAFITAVNVVIVPLISLLLYKKRLDRFEIIGAVLAISGIGMMSLQMSGAINFGDLLTLLCAFAFAFHIVYTAKFVQDEDPILLTFIQLTTAAFIGFFIVMLRGEIRMNVEVQALLPLLYLGVFSTTIAYLLQTSAQKFLSETKAAIILSTEALWGMMFSIVLLQEVITLRMAFGAMLILLAILISEIKLGLFKILTSRQRIG